MVNIVRLVACVGLLAGAIPDRGARADNRGGECTAAPQEVQRTPRPRVTVSGRTTVITSPLRKHGYPDYRAALNEIGRGNINRENNAAVLLWRAFGPAELLEDRRTEFFRSLQLPSLPAEGEYFVSFDEYVRSIRDSEEALSRMPVLVDEDFTEDYLDPGDCARRQLDDALMRPWSAAEYPVVAGWLKVNEKPLALVVGASRRPRMYCPLEGPYLFSCDLPHLRLVRRAADALNVRATQSVAAGKLEDAWQDLLAIQRLARLTAQGSTLIESLVALHVERIAGDGTLVLLSSTDLTAKQARRFQADLRGLSRMPSLAEKIDVGERYAFLDAVCWVAQDPVRTVETYLDLPGDKHTAAGTFMRSLTKASIRIADGFLVDWDDALRTGNHWFDRTVAAARKPTFRERSMNAERIEGEIRQTAPFWIRALFFDAAEPAARPPYRVTFGQMAGEFGVCLLFPSVKSALQSEEQGSARRSMTQIAIALARYRREHGRYPSSLAGLRPKYLEEIPKDPFTGGELRYQLRPGGYLLFSVGPNGQDDGGRNWREEHDTEPPRIEKDDNIPREADDLAIHMPKQGR